jgi:membrane-bound lytic murein transglycosylase F
MLCSLGFLLTACDFSLVRNDLEAIIARNELVVITRNNATCYYEGPHGDAGFEYELAKAFADDLGVRLRIVIMEEEADMVAALLKGEADLIAAGFLFGRQSARLLVQGPGYLEVTQKLVGRRGGPEIQKISDLKDIPVWTTGSSSRLGLLHKLKQKHPELTWQTLSDYSAEELLQMVWSRSLPFTIVESNVLRMNRRYFPELLSYLDLTQPQRIAWATDPKNHRLLRAMNAWFSKEEVKEKIKGLTDYYYSHLIEFDYVDLARYRRRISSRLPKYRNWFEEAAAQHGLDWQLVAALAYQESHWNPKAKSYTGVRGMMMLTLDTAKTLGLKNRTEAKESIFAGTRYLARLKRLIGDKVPEPDRTLLALAAYNIGYGHLQDARTLAQRLGKPADSWRGVRAVLPLLQQKQFYRALNHGYARGNEAVQYVDRIRTYHTVLNTALAPTVYIGYGG